MIRRRAHIPGGLLAVENPPSPTGIMGLDRALGGGLPVGTFTEIFGSADAPARDLALRIARAHRGGGVLWCDLTGDLRRGELMDDALVSTGSGLMQVITTCRAILARGGASLMVIDPVDALLDPGRAPPGVGLWEDLDRGVAIAVRSLAVDIRRAGAAAVLVGFAHEMRGAVRSALPRVVTPYLAARIACRTGGGADPIRCDVTCALGPGGAVIIA